MAIKRLFVQVAKPPVALDDLSGVDFNKLLQEQAAQAAARRGEKVADDVHIETSEEAAARESYRVAEMPMKRSALDDLSEADFEKLLEEQSSRIASQEFVGETVAGITLDAGSLKQAEGRMKRAPRRAPVPVRRDLFQEVTDRMVQAIEEGTAPWQKPWQGHLGWPANPTTGKPYHGINVLLLATAGYQDPRWCSYEQAKKAGWQVRSGEKAERIYFYKLMTKGSGELDPVTCLPKVEKVIPLFRSHPIFNLSQIDNAPKLETGVQHEVVLDDVTEQTILDLIEASGAQFNTGRSHAAYFPKQDWIDMPAKETFESDAHYYAAKFHELAHWTGHESRLNRPFSFDKSSVDYAREELRAEMASAMISMQMGIPPGVKNHEGYVANYLKILRDDKKEIFRAAKDAETISRFILRYNPDLKIRLEEEVRDQAQAAADAGAPEEFFDASLFDDFETPSFKP